MARHACTLCRRDHLVRHINGFSHYSRQASRQTDRHGGALWQIRTQRQCHAGSDVRHWVLLQPEPETFDIMLAKVFVPLSFNRRVGAFLMLLRHSTSGVNGGHHLHLFIYNRENYLFTCKRRATIFCVFNCLTVRQALTRWCLMAPRYVTTALTTSLYKKLSCCCDSRSYSVRRMV